MTTWLTSSALNEWNFGTLPQRLSFANWCVIGGRLVSFVVPWVWPFCLVGVVASVWAPVAQRLLLLGLAAGSVLTPLIFFNLYLVHDYYLCAIVIPVWLLAAKGIEVLLAPWRMPHVRAIGVLALSALLAWISSRATYVLSSYMDWRTHEVYQFARAICDHTPSDAELLVLGDEWNPRIPYYSERKAFMLYSPASTLADALRYVAERRLRYVVAVGAERARVVVAWPGAQLVLASPNCSLYELPLRLEGAGLGVIKPASTP